jgi:signal transduction histidine kinase
MSDERHSGRGATRWLTIHDDLLRALAHSLSNRMSTLTAITSLLEHGMTPDPRITSGLQGDAERLEELLTSLRALPRRVDPMAEPMLLADALAGARSLIDEHPAMRDRTITIEPQGDVQPVRAEPGAVLHACAVAMLAAARYTPPGGALRLTLATDGDVVRVEATGEPGPHYGADALLADDAEAIRWLLAADGGRAEIRDAGCAFTLPTLQATRRRPG